MFQLVATRPDENQVRVSGTESVRSSTDETITDNVLNKAKNTKNQILKVNSRIIHCGYKAKPTSL